MPTSKTNSRKRSTNSATRGAAGTMAAQAPQRLGAASVATPTSARSTGAVTGKTAPVAPVAVAPDSTLRHAWVFLRGPYPTLISRAVLGFIFLTAGVTKAMTIPAFQGEIAAYQMVPNALIIPMATLLPLAEIFIAAFLLIGLQTRWAALGSGIMFVMFEVAILSAMARHLQIECGCFGNVDFAALKTLRDTVGWRKVIEDGVYLLLSAHLFFIPTIFALDQRQT